MIQSNAPTRCLKRMIMLWGKWRLMVFIVMVPVVIIPSVSRLLSDIEQKYQKSEKVHWYCANGWIKSADCMRKTGAWLVVCDNMQLVPLSEVSFADDPGHALLLGIAATILGKNVGVADIAVLNVLINLCALLVLLVLLFALKVDLIWMLLLILADKIFFSLISDSPHPSHTGVAAMAAVLPITISFCFFHDNWGRLRKTIFIFIGLILFSVATLIRGVIGHMGFIVSMVVLFIAGFKHRNSVKKMGVLMIIAALVVVAWQSQNLVLMARDVLFDVQAAHRIQGHGIAHNLYIGLGAVPNKFGISWNDADGTKAVKQVSPETGYVTPEYFRILLRLYLERLKEDPMEVLRIYKEKAWQLLQKKFWAGWLPLWVTLLLGFGLTVQLWKRKTEQWLQPTPLLLITYVSLGFMLFFLIQGILAHPSRQYAAPIDVFSALLMGVIAEYGWRSLMLKKGLLCETTGKN